MKRLSFTVRTRLLALCLGLMAVLGGANLLLAHMIGENEAQHLAQREQYRRSEVIRAVERGVLRERHIGGQLNSARLAGVAEQQEFLSEQLASARREQEIHVRELERFNPEAASKIRSAFKIVPHFQQQIMDAIAQGRNEKLPALVAAMQVHLDSVQEALEQASRVEIQRAEQMSAREIKRISKAKQLATAIVLLVSVTGTLLTLLVMRSVLVPLREITAAIRQLNLGYTDIDLPPISKDEFGDIAIALRQFREQAETLRKRAYEDSLTGLGNRVLLEEELPKAIETCRTKASTLALFCLDLDNFRAINDRFGHKAGDRYLCEAASRLHRFMPPEATIFRYEGDNFVVLVEGLDAEQSAHNQLRQLASTALRGLSEPYMLGDQLANMSASIGISSYPADGDTAEQLISGADAAMHVAKKNGRNNLRFAGSQATGMFRKQLGITGEIRRGLERGEFVAFYQPIVDLRQNRVVAAEALLRWRHPQRGLLLPGEFINAAEQSGLISTLGELCLVSACKQSARWQAAGRGIRIAVNLSAHQVHEGNVLHLLKSLESHYSVAGSEKLIDFELTESSLLDVAERGQSTLDQIKSMGYRLGLDDFGIAYSSLSYLQTLPIDKIKIDRQFTAALSSSRAATAIVSAIITLGRALDLDVIAEGVETAEQSAELEKLGCSVQQGFFFSPALPEWEFERWSHIYERGIDSMRLSNGPYFIHG